MDFKEFLEDVQKGEARRDLFLVPSVVVRKFEMQRLMDEAHVLGLDPRMNQSDGVIAFKQSFAMFRVAHAYVDASLRGISLTGIHGTDCLDQYDRAEDAKLNLKLMVRE